MADQAAEPAFETDRLILSLPRTDMAAAMLDFVVRNRAHLAPWSPPEPAGVHTIDHWQDIVAKSAAAFAGGNAVRFWIAPKNKPEKAIGSISYSQISRGPFCACVLGYQIDREHEGRGLMREALRASNHYMFTQQKLHRIGANYRPENVRSGRLLAKLGFRIEGYAKEYLFIDGAWRDHVLTSLAHSGFESGWIKMG